MIINYSDEKIIKDRKSIFLAGPTQKKMLFIGEKKAIRILEKNEFDGTNICA